MGQIIGKLLGFCKSRDLSYFSSIPEDLVYIILSKTSPRDVCRMSNTIWVASSFRAACESNTIWQNFLSDIPPNIIASNSSRFSYKKELFFHICSEYHALIDNNTKLLELDKSSGKIICTIQGGSLSTSRPRSGHYVYWSEYPEVPTTINYLPMRMGVEFGTGFNVQTKLDTRKLSLNTAYKAYLVYKVDEGFSPSSLVYFPLLAKINIRVRKAVISSEESIVPGDSYSIRRRNDSWMEVDLGEFYNGKIDDVGACLDISVKEFCEVPSYPMMCFLYIHGIVLRPKQRKHI